MRMSGRLKSVVWNAYRQATIPYRLWLRRQLLATHRAPILIFYYHRVADVDPVPWSLTNAQFCSHIEWLKQHFEMVSLEDMDQCADLLARFVENVAADASFTP